MKISVNLIFDNLYEPISDFDISSVAGLTEVSGPRQAGQDQCVSSALEQERNKAENNFLTVCQQSV